MYNDVHELTNQQMYEEAELVLRPVGSARVGGPYNTFLFCQVLFELKRCDLSKHLLDDALEVLRENPDAVGSQHNKPPGRMESNLLASKALCETEITVHGKYCIKPFQ
jgi:hypothetical protein